MKPRIRLSLLVERMWPESRWVCFCGDLVGYGPTPDAAFNAWAGFRKRYFTRK